MKRLVIALVVVAVGFLLWPTSPDAPALSGIVRGSGASTDGVGGPDSSAPRVPPDATRPSTPRLRVDAAQALRMRLDVAHTIASARRAAREASEVPAEAERDPEPLLDAMMVVRRCWPPDYDGQISLRFDFVDDPELGRFIDTPPITGDDDLPIDPALDDCIRDAVEEWHFANAQDRSRSR